MSQSCADLPVSFGLITCECFAATSSDIRYCGQPPSADDDAAGASALAAANSESGVCVATRSQPFLQQLQRTFGAMQIHELAPRNVPDALAQQLARFGGVVILFADESLAQSGNLWSPSLRAHIERMRLVVVTDRHGPLVCELLLSCGARGCVRRDADTVDLRRATRAVCAGELWVPREVLAVLYERAVAEPAPTFQQPEVTDSDASAAHGVPLTEREVQVIELAHGGQSNKEIARALGISDNTVKKHIAHAFDKLGVRRRRQLIV